MPGYGSFTFSSKLESWKFGFYCTFVRLDTRHKLNVWYTLNLRPMFRGIIEKAPPALTKNLALLF